MTPTPITSTTPEALRAAIAAFHDSEADRVVATTGSSEALSIFFCLAARPGAHMLMPDPGYPAYAAVAQARAANRVRSFMLNQGYGEGRTRGSRRVTDHYAASAAADPTFAKAHYNLGLALGWHGRRTEALAELRVPLPE